MAHNKPDDLNSVTDDLNKVADDLDKVFGQIDARMDSSTLPGPEDQRKLFLDWVTTVTRSRGSDLFLVAGSPPMMRIDGTLVAVNGATRLGPRQLESIVLQVIDRAAADRYRAKGIVDASVRIDGVGRFRINLHHERRNPAAAIRILPSHVPQFAKLRLPAEMLQLATLTSGLVLIGGATGSGKSTTMAALINAINEREAKHIITVEDPIEYEHDNARSLIEHVEIGVDAPDYPTALRAAVRQAPDIIVIGEMRDPESMRIALSAAETGHLVFSSVHTMDVAATVGRISDSFPNERQNTIRQELSHALSAVVTQHLIPAKAGGRVPAAEILMVSYGARQHIRKNALQHLHQEITLTKKLGSLTIEESLARLVKADLITPTEASLRSRHPDELEGQLRG
jgi:twitching motility protein PilT